MLDHSTAEWLEPDRHEIDPTAGRLRQWGRNHVALLDHAVQEGLEPRLDAIATRVQSLADALHGRLTDEVPNATVRDRGRERCGIVTFSLDGTELSTMQAALRSAGINVSGGPPVSPSSIKASVLSLP